MERLLMELPSKSLLVEHGKAPNGATKLKSPTGASKGYKVSHTRHTGRNQRVTLSLCIKIDQRVNLSRCIKIEDPASLSRPTSRKCSGGYQKRRPGTVSSYKVIVLSVGYKAKSASPRQVLIERASSRLSGYGLNT